MKETRILMGMPVAVEISDISATEEALQEVFSYFEYVDATSSTYKSTSEISQINRGELKPADYSDNMKEVFRLSEETKQLTREYFDIKKPDGSYDPSGLVKGWAIYNAAERIKGMGYKEYYVDAGGDIEARGKVWKIGIKNPFKQNEIVKVLYIQDIGVATSGTYIRGDHIYDPTNSGTNMDEIASLTVIGPNVYEADRFATAAFAMGKEGINFIQNLEGFEGYLIDQKGIATYTTGFEAFTKEVLQ